MSKERWLPVVGWEGFYEVSDRGRVRSVDRVVETSDGPRRYRGRVLSLALRESGHLHVGLHTPEKGSRYFKVHRLVLEAFFGPCPEGMESRHLNGDPAYNRFENLSWGTREENMADRVPHGVSNRGSRHGNSRLNAEAVKVIWLSARQGVPRRLLADLHGVSYSAICGILYGKSWAWLTGGLSE